MISDNGNRAMEIFTGLCSCVMEIELHMYACIYEQKTPLIPWGNIMEIDFHWW